MPPAQNNNDCLPTVYPGPTTPSPEQLPSPPPAPPQPWRPKRRRCRCLRSCFCFCCCSWFSCIFYTFFCFPIVFSLLWMVLHRHKDPHVYAYSASLSRFDLSNTTQFLDYYLTVGFSIRNFHNYSVQYSWLEPSLHYGGVEVRSVRLPGFTHGRKSTATLGLVVFAGRSEFAGPGEFGVQEFEREKGFGAFDVVVKLYGRMRFKSYGSIWTRWYTMKKRCDLVLRVRPNQTTDNGFPRITCMPDY